MTARLVQLTLILVLGRLAAAAISNCPAQEGNFVIDRDPPFVRWEFSSAKKAPLFINDADPATFTTLPAPSGDPSKAQCANGAYGKDKTHVFYEYMTLEKAAPASFRSLAGDYGRDEKRIYWKAREVKGADPRSFKVLDQNLGKDDGKYFYQDEGFSQSTYRHFDVDYTALGPQILFRGKTGDAADVKSFVVLGLGWARDKSFVYFENHRVPGLDLESFHPIGAGFYADKRGVRPTEEVDNASSSGLPGLSIEKTVPIEKTSFHKLVEPCRSADARVRCVTDGTYLVAVVQLSEGGSYEIKAAKLSDVRYNTQGFLQFGSEVFEHLKRIDKVQVERINLLSLGTP